MSPTHFVRLSQSVHLDLEWWFQFAKQWNGKAMIYRRPKELAQGLLVSDASGSWGCGAFFCDKWFQLEWAGNLKNTHISVKELVPITAIWGPEWSMESIEVKCNNAAVVAVLNSGSNRNPESGLLSSARFHTRTIIVFDLHWWQSYLTFQTLCWQLCYLQGNIWEFRLFYYAGRPCTGVWMDQEMAACSES